MYRVMLIDDEASARNLLKISVNWAELNMEVVGEAASGIEAINTIDDVRPDIAFVDISMPFMDGLEFTELATKRYPNLIIIIMTALDDFEYARKCIRLPVMDYMLKPVVRRDVFETLQRAREELDEKASARKPEDEKEPEPGDSSMEHVKTYIKQNYTDPQLNLTSASTQLGFSPSYLSRKFKQETGTGFVEYLTACRMRKAMELAARGFKMFSASQEVGIPDPNYFGKCFKKYTGKSYSEYSQEMRKKITAGES